ncbi:UDP-2,3-diacylglucosamine diphosphatase [Sedimenticola selenatireducens]|uniref:UDP-2,3-diacylglucosamine hydrolase n=1 Tax=Sedimenticola selenatireducens TaxID=191960 RepID=A0A2N6CRV5_9GAMM|nr:UDP-2,3-diacylglucosamine diphosphatase [Sedimenticola selenatireducens]PLX59816.1 MAG: UDP-2,3-diacylglucosamine diphosphatase [Sedimenticola selenatireducens]
MSDTLIISDLHLSQHRPDTVALFLHFLRERACGAGELYILGDLFDAWIGDDNILPPVPEVVQALRQLTDGGCKLSVMHGNRDFLLGSDFARATGGKLLPDPFVADLGGETTLLMHGDLLCTDDLEYQQARKLLRSPEFIRDFVSRTIEERVQLAAEYRRRSGEVVSLKSADIMDVNQQTVERYMREYQVRRLIHGHTHRPALHEFQLDGTPAQRYVLEDWHEQTGSYLLVDNQSIRQEAFS